MDGFPARQLFIGFLVLVAFAIFGWTCRRLLSVMLKGRPFPGKLTGWGSRIGDVLVYFVLQRSVAREKASLHHLLIFWGFLVITVGTLEIILAGVSNNLITYRAMFGATVDDLFKAVLDVTNAVVLVVILYSFFRRLVLKPRLIPMSFDAALILSMIGLLCLSHFVSHGFHHAAVHGVDARIAASMPPPGPPGTIEFMPVTAIFASIGAGLSPATAHNLAEVNYWAHLLIVLFFLNYIPYSKHIHLLGALPNILLRNRGQQGVLPRLDLEDEKQWGVGYYERFHWKSLLDTYACTECARCSNNCPANLTDKPLSPMKLIHDLRDEMIARGARLGDLTPGVDPTADPDAEPDDDEGGGEGAPPRVEPTEQDQRVIAELAQAPPLVGGRIETETLWACTTCGACEAVCPVFIEHPQKIIEMRTHLVLAESEMPAELTRMFKGMENNQNPWGIGSDQRLDWAEGRDVPLIADKGEAEWLVWIGCAGAFDDRAKKVSLAWLDVLDEAGVDYAILGEEEACCGDAARRAGNEFLFQTLAEANVEILKGHKVKKIVTTCPHGYHSLKHEYPQFGGDFEVWHHSQLIPKLIAEGKLKPDVRLDGLVTYHDACYLGRWNDVYEQPRQLLQSVTGQRPAEMPRNHRKSFCCGAGGGHMWMEEEAPRVNYARTEEALATGARTIATACPFCNVMLTDGVKFKEKDEDVRVLDLAEIVAQSCSAVAARRARAKAATASSSSD